MEAFHCAGVRCSIFYTFVLVKLEPQLGLKRYTALSYAFAAATVLVLFVLVSLFVLLY
jgi:hypothetical protein